MDWLTLLLVGIGLSMDAFAVSISCGIASAVVRFRHAFRIAFTFGLFQAVMPLAGWAAGMGFRSIISAFDHWIAFGLLLIIGLKMMREALRGCPGKLDAADWRILLTLSVDTSMDAMAVGLSFAMLEISIVTPVLIIGLITFALSFAGVYLGDRVGDRLGRKVEVLGGLILIGIGIKILVEHLS